METSRGLKIFKIVMTILFGGLVATAMVWLHLKGDFEKPYLSYGIVIACFLLSLIFIRKSASKLLITLALGVTVAADYFLIFSDFSSQNQLIGTCIFCGVQFVYMVYTLFLNKGNGRRIINLASRVLLCLVAYFVIPLYFTLGTLEMICVMYIINFAINIFVVLLHVKQEWLLLLGLLLFFVCDISIGLVFGGGVMGLPVSVINGLANANLSFWCYYPGLFFIALSSVWAKKRQS